MAFIVGRKDDKVRYQTYIHMIHAQFLTNFCTNLSTPA